MTLLGLLAWPFLVLLVIAIELASRAYQRRHMRPAAGSAERSESMSECGFGAGERHQGAAPQPQQFAEAGAAVEALVGLGYGKTEARRLVEGKAVPGMTTQEIVRAALKQTVPT